MKKIVLLSERLPFPPVSGTKNLLYNYCKILHEKMNLEVINLSFFEQGEDIFEKPDFISKVYKLPNPSWKAKIKNIILRTFIRREYPLQVSLFWDPIIKKKVDDILDDVKPDYVIADFIRTTEYLKDFQGYKIADLQDLLSLRYERQLKMDLHTINPYGAYLYRMPKLVQVVLQFNFIKKSVMEMEVKLLKKFELDVGRYYDRVMFVAKQEGKRFDGMLGEKKSLIAPLGVDYSFFSQELHLKKKENSIAFMGALNVAHNENGIIHFIKYCFPAIKKKIPGVRLYIIGDGNSNKLKHYEAPNIIFTGRVTDVRVAIGECEVFICPLQFGSGIKTKNLEAMAMGMPVVTTPIGAENIDAADGSEWIIAENDEDFVKAVVKLLNSNPACRREMGEAAQKFILDKFTWENAERALKSIINS